MKSFKKVVESQSGINMKIASAIAKESTKYDSEVNIVVGDSKFNAKSLIGIISACIKHGDEIEFTVEGADESEAFEQLEAYAKENL